MRILFLGNPKFHTLYKDALETAGHKIVGLDEKPDLGVIAYYGKIIKPDVLKIPKYGFINIHPSLLPKYRGPSPVRSAILAGDAVTGVTIHITVDKVDAGDILAQKEFPIDPEDNYESLEEKLFKEGAKMLPEVVEKWISEEIKPKPQDESQATYTKIFKTEDGHIDWETDAEKIARQIKACSPNPGAFTTLDGKRLLILSAVSEKSSHDLAPGQVTESFPVFKIAAAGGFVVPSEVKLEGRKNLKAADFLRGQKYLIGKVLE